MITLVDTAKEDFKKDRKGVKVFESLCELLSSLEVVHIPEMVERDDFQAGYILKAVKNHLQKTQEVEFIRMRPYEYKVFYKGKTYYVDTLYCKVEPPMRY